MEGRTDGHKYSNCESAIEPIDIDSDNSIIDKCFKV